VMLAVDDIATIFTGLGPSAARARAARHALVRGLPARRPGFQSVRGRARHRQWKTTCRDSRVRRDPTYGCGLWTVAACRARACEYVARARRPVGAPVDHRTGTIEDDFPLPAIVKPAAKDASAGLDGSRSRRPQESQGARRGDDGAVRRVLVQQYIAGREFNVGFVGDRALRSPRSTSQACPRQLAILTYSAKWETGRPRTSAAAGVPGADLAAPRRPPRAVAEALADDAGDGLRPRDLRWTTPVGRGCSRSTPIRT